jgi:dynein heavy chain
MKIDSLAVMDRADQTPRKIEIERRKRLFSSQNVTVLVNQELEEIRAKKRQHFVAEKQGASTISSSKETIATVPETDYAQFLPYELFDDTEFEQRTLEEWLDLRVATGLHSSRMVSPVTNSADHSDVDAQYIKSAKIPIPGKAFVKGEWLNCFVMAYNTQTKLWKVVFRQTSGWELERHPELFDVEKTQSGDAKDTWLPRYEFYNSPKRLQSKFE